MQISKWGLQLAAASAVMAAGPAFASDVSSAYMRAAAGLSQLRSDDGLSLEFGGERSELRTKFDQGLQYGVAVGIEGYALDLELEYKRLRHDIREPGATRAASNALSAAGPFINVLLPLRDSGEWRPYLGAGVGYVEGKTDAAKDHVLGVQARVGIAYALWQHFRIDLALDYLGTERMQLNVDQSREGEFSVDYQSVGVGLGVRYVFASAAGSTP